MRRFPFAFVRARGDWRSRIVASNVTGVDDETKIAELEAAFARGDYARVSKEAGPLAASTKDSNVRARATKLTAKIAPDPIAKVLFIIAAVLLLAMSAYFEFRSR